MPPSVSRIQQFALSTASWTPVIAPINCSYYIIVGNQDGTAMLRCSDPNDPNSSYTMPAGGWYSLLATGPVYPNDPGNTCRYKAGTVMTYLKALTGAGPAIVEFIL